jgi:hypothetical protein
MTLMGKLKGAAVITVALAGFHAYQMGAAATPAATTDAVRGAAHGGAVRGGTLDCAGLERLWEQAGGSRAEAFMAAEIAMAESSGRQYAVNTNGGRSTDRGYWQINSVHGSLSTYNAYGNARAAVLISHDGTNWSPWVTYQIRSYEGKC